MPPSVRRGKASIPALTQDYGRLVSGISGLLEKARRTAARSVNSILTATYWEIGRRIVEFEQGGKTRAEYGERLLVRLADDLTTKYGRGFSGRNLRQMRTFYLGWEIWQTPSAKLEARAKCPTLSGESEFGKRQTASANSRSTNIIQTASEELGIVQASPAASLAQAPRFPLPWSHYVRLLAVE